MRGLGLIISAFAFTISCYAAPAPSEDFCNSPPPLENAFLEGDWNNETYAPGHLANYSCQPGYLGFRGGITMICSKNNWIPKIQRKIPKSCKKKSCGHPGEIDFGSFKLVSGEQFVFGATVEYSCNEGYQMVTKQKTRDCTATGWTNAKPICEARLCPPVLDESLRVLSTLFDDEYTMGQVIRLQCKNPKNKLVGPSQIFCTSNGTWNADPPTCKGPCIVQQDNMTHHNIRLKNYKRQSIPYNEAIEFECLPGYAIPDPKNLLIKCSEGTFTYPTCHRNGRGNRRQLPCYYHPKVEYGETFGAKKDMYVSGSVLQIQCINYYKLQGKRFIKCRNGVWEDPPICLEPCVLNNNYIHGNNTHLVKEHKKYLKHGESVTFKCLPKFKISDRSLLKVKCTEGKILYPKCKRS